MSYLGSVWYICLKTKNCCLKTFVEIRVGEKVWKYVKCCLKTKTGCLKTQTKHPLNVSFQRLCSLSLSLSSKLHDSSLSPQPSFSLTLPSAPLSQPRLRLHQSLHLHACSLPLPQPRRFLHSQLKPRSKNKEKTVYSNSPAEIPTPHTRTLFRLRSERE